MTDSLYTLEKMENQKGMQQLGDTVPFDVLLWTEEAGLKSGGRGGGGENGQARCFMLPCHNLRPTDKEKTTLAAKRIQKGDKHFCATLQRNKYSQKGNCAASAPISKISCLCEQYICSHDQSANSAAGNYVDRSWEYINRSQTHELWKLGLRPRNSFSGNT